MAVAYVTVELAVTNGGRQSVLIYCGCPLVFVFFQHSCCFTVYQVDDLLGPVLLYYCMIVSSIFFFFMALGTP